MYWGYWGTGVFFLAVALGFFAVWRRSRYHYYALAASLSFLAAVAALVTGWYLWPRQTAGRFMTLAYDRSYRQLNDFLPDGQKWETLWDDSLTLRAEDGSTFSLPAFGLPLVTEGHNETSTLDRWLGQYHFKLRLKRNGLSVML